MDRNAWIGSAHSARVLHVVPYLEPAWAFGPVAREVLQLARAQAMAGDEVAVLTTDALAPHERLPSGESTVDGVRVIRVPNISGAVRTWLGLSTPRGLRRQLRALLKGRALDVVHLHELRTVENVLVARTVTNDVPFVLSPYGQASPTPESSFKAAWDAMVGNRVLSRVQQLTARSEREAGEIRAMFANRGLHLHDRQVSITGTGVDFPETAGGVDTPSARRQFALADGPVVLFVDRLSERSGVLMLIEAFASVVRSEQSQAQLVIVGSDHGLLARARQLTAHLGIESAVRFPGYLSASHVGTAIAVADVLALPSLDGELSPAAVQALAAGVPALLSASYRLPQGAAIKSSAVLERDTGAWATAMSSILNADAATQSVLRANARELAMQFTWTATAARMKHAYQAARAAMESRSG